MINEPDANSIVKEAFREHDVDNPQLEKAISDILYETLDSRKLSKRIWKDVQEHIDRDQKTRDRFK